ncbi:hypothetical protein COT77_03250 [Candidatus Berkelbacteria bacterium CG10_big_fil_rev_8_21_14_0_10_41_12]|uniref:Reverse transcriptase domain-containing protein n=1 Tax=Candidatus Berkelbacteria bacterium CG10_big_fil_rev_8_21_14_0_10_41_12 TaxID=1974513 RepID=A0A2M6WWD1_9BACT|nr:MAG: hypothetical protein COT77_03250 [Candidatus Berkelbacteria bacterium CG10_big_fil_rev_8_21_14_0_10_41_12]
MKTATHLYSRIISIDNLLIVWEKFVMNKKKKRDMRIFAQNLFPNILSLHNDLTNLTYRHANYECFNVCDPKPRIIHKAIVRDRLLHHAIYRVLMPIFDKTFIFDCYSCRKLKGTHRAFRRLVVVARKQSKNYSQACCALKCDIRKFFHSIDHQVLIEFLSQRIVDEKLMNLLTEIIESFESLPSKGMPLGNLTSQLFANIYMDPLDKFVKHKLKAKYYLRYADDFMFLANNRELLLEYLREVEQFLGEHLKLSFHPDKIVLRKLNWGLDFVGYVTFPNFNLPRKKTTKRMFIKLERIRETQPEKLRGTLQSYAGYLKHINANSLSLRLKKHYT